MRSFLLAALTAIASAAKVHEFFAENNFICEMCQKAVKLSSQNRDDEIDALFTMFPVLNQRINTFHSQSNGVVDLSKPWSTCQQIDLCETEDVANQLRLEEPQDLESIIELVNNDPTSTWKAAKNIKFDGATTNEVRKLMGTVVDPQWTIKAHQKEFNVSNDDVVLPVNFDAREQWPECESVINHVRDQSNCGSCWAHGTTEAFNDRMCIVSGGAYLDLLSVSDTSSCCDPDTCFSFNCNGGQVATPWQWFEDTGVVTGGDYGDTQFCYAYTMPKCAHHVAPTGDLVDCTEIATTEPTCGTTCPDNADITYADDKVKTGGQHYAITGVENIKSEMYTYGSVTAAITVYEDFEVYTGGVYQHTYGAALGGHAFKCIGWGVDATTSTDYWLCVNSWNDTWGESGTFKIKMGDCGINDQIHAGVVTYTAPTI